jgi:hypothetical protein
VIYNEQEHPAGFAGIARYRHDDHCAAFAQQQQKPNILVIMAEDTGYWKISAYNHGMMGYHTPNIDRTASRNIPTIRRTLRSALNSVRAASLPMSHGMRAYRKVSAKVGFGGSVPRAAKGSPKKVLGPTSRACASTV